jgi:hypothetical protein
LSGALAGAPVVEFAEQPDLVAIFTEHDDIDYARVAARTADTRHEERLAIDSGSTCFP